MLSYQYHRVLRKIAEETFPEATILPFKIEIHPKEMKSRHGDYHPGKKVIRIFNLSQKNDYTIATALHELAHHCEFSLYGKTGHSKQFYETFKSLLETAIFMGVVDYEVIRLQENAVQLQDFHPAHGRKYALIFGNEVDGVQQSVVDASDLSLEIPQSGTKHSLNVSVSVGVILWQMRR